MIERPLLDTKGVAHALGEPVRAVRDRISLLPDFPKPLRFGSNGRRRWYSDEIDRWMRRPIPYRPAVITAVRNKKLTMSGFPEYNAWKKMRDRCSNPNSQSYKWYGARGISVCARWDDFSLFLKDVGRRPSKKHSLDRINNYRGYEPGNCRWATSAEQYANRRCPRCDHAPCS